MCFRMWNFFFVTFFFFSHYLVASAEMTHVKVLSVTFSVFRAPVVRYNCLNKHKTYVGYKVKIKILYTPDITAVIDEVVTKGTCYFFLFCPQILKINSCSSRPPYVAKWWAMQVLLHNAPAEKNLKLSPVPLWIKRAARTVKYLVILNCGQRSQLWQLTSAQQLCTYLCTYFCTAQLPK